jgi:hypothetical protein
MQSVLLRFQSLGVAGRQALFGERAGQRWIFRSNSGYLGRERLTDYSILWICSVLLILGAGALIDSMVEGTRSLSPAHWPTTFGTIRSVRVLERYEGGDARWYPELVYQYSIQGRTIANTRLTRGSEVSWRDRSAANEFLERYITRSRVLVYYNPANTSESVLEPSSGGLEAGAWVGIFMIVTAVSILLIYARLS